MHDSDDIPQPTSEAGEQPHLLSNAKTGTQPVRQASAYEHLSPEDSTFIYAESDTNIMQIGGVMIFEDTGTSYRDICAQIESRLHYLPLFRKKLMTVPFDQGRPVWVDDDKFDIRFHVRRTGLPYEGGRAELRDLTARLMSNPLDRSRPLWEIWLVDMPGDERGLIYKVHHSVVDGVSGIETLTVLLDATPETPPAAEAPEWKPDPAPSATQLFGNSVREQFSLGRRLWNVASAAAASPQSAIESISEVGRGLRSYVDDVIGGTPKTSLRVKIGSSRRFETAEVAYSDVKHIKDHLGVKINDVLLALTAGGISNLLQGRDEPIDGIELQAVVPVSVRDGNDHATSGNKVSSMFARLPLGVKDPAERLRRIGAWMDRQKESGETRAVESLMDLSEWIPAGIVSLATRVGMVELAGLTNLIITNVPGPPFPLYFHGGELIEGYPYFPPTGKMSVAVAIVSYNGKFEFGISGDWNAVPDLALVSEGIEKATAELLGAL